MRNEDTTEKMRTMKVDQLVIRKWLSHHTNTKVLLDPVYLPVMTVTPGRKLFGIHSLLTVKRHVVPTSNDGSS